MREHLLNIIDLFSINGEIDSCTWVIKNDTLSIEAITPHQDVVVKINTSLLCKNGTFGVYSASQMRSMIYMMDDSFMFLPEPRQNVILMSDTNYSVQLRTADTSTIPKAPKINIPPKPTITIPLDLNGFNTKCLVAYKSLKDTDTIKFGSRLGFIEGVEPHIVIGDADAYENTVEVKQEGECSEMKEHIPFSMNMLSKIFAVSKKYTGTLKVYEEGLMHISLSDKITTAEYFVVRKS